MKITRLRVTNYRGIAVLDTRGIFNGPIPPQGFTVKGGNGAGKSTVLNAIRAALVADDIASDAIRIGADRAEILLDLDDFTVKRALTARGSRLSIDGADAASIRSPADWLATMVGAAPFDPIDLFSKKPKERRAAILGAMPMRVSPAELDGWLDGWTLATPADHSLHALEVVEHARKDFYARRGAANASAKAMQKDLDALVAGAPPAVPGAPSEADARAKHEAAYTAHGEIVGRRKRVEEHATRTARARGRVAELRLAASNIRAVPAPVDRRAEIDRRSKDAHDEVARLREELRILEDAVGSAISQTHVIGREREAMAAELDAHAKAIAIAKANEDQAADLEATIAETSEAPPTDEDIAAAAAAVHAAVEEQGKAIAATKRAEHEARIATKRAELAAEHTAAGKLETMVAKFTKEVPAALLAKADSAHGLALDGDSIFLDGVDIEKLSGREQLMFAVEIARRLNARAKILIVDGLERVDADSLPVFLEKATADGYQLIATRVESGAVVFEAIEVESKE